MLGTVCVCFHNKVPGPDYFNYATELYAGARRTRMYLYIAAMYFCCCPLFCNTAVVAAAAAVRHRVPDGQIWCCGSLHLISVSFFSRHNSNTICF